MIGDVKLVDLDIIFICLKANMNIMREIKRILKNQIELLRD